MHPRMRYASGKLSPALHAIRRVKRPTVRLGDALGDREAQSCAASRAVARCIAAIHRYKQVWQISWRNAWPTIRNAEAEVPVLDSPIYLNRAARRRMSHRIIKQVF